MGAIKMKNDRYRIPSIALENMPSKKNTIIAMIPARLGSTRLKRKNLALLNGKPLISYAIETAKKSGIFSRIILNSEHRIFKEMASRYNVEFYQRPKEYASSQTRSDEVVYDFLLKNKCDTLAWVNSINPLQTEDDIRRIVDYFHKEKCDSLMTIREEFSHGLFKGNPLNFSKEELFSRTQDLNPIQILVYSIMMWRTKAFIDTYRKKGHAFLCGNVGFYPVSKLAALTVKTQEDLFLIEAIMKGMESQNFIESKNIKYDLLAQYL